MEAERERREEERMKAKTKKYNKKLKGEMKIVIFTKFILIIYSIIKH